MLGESNIRPQIKLKVGEELLEKNNEGSFPMIQMRGNIPSYKGQQERLSLLIDEATELGKTKFYTSDEVLPYQLPHRKRDSKQYE